MRNSESIVPASEGGFWLSCNEKFIELNATKGSMSGDPYLIHCANVPSQKKLSLAAWRTRKSSCRKICYERNIIFAALKKLMKYNLNPALYGNFSRLSEQASLLLSLLIHVSGVATSEHAKIVEIARKKLACRRLRLVEKSFIDRASLDAAVTKLNRLKPLLKPRLLKVLASVLDQGSQTKTSGQEVLRAVAEVLDCPIPVLVSEG